MYNQKRSLDWISLTLYLSLIVIGWLMLYSASARELESSGFTWSSTIGRQTIWLGIALLAFIATLMINWKYWYRMAYIFYGISIFLLLAVLLFGVEVKGARSWIRLFGMTIQPSEFAKLTTTLALAAFLSHFRTNLRRSGFQLISVGILALPVLLVGLQPDMGSALVFLSFVIVLYRAGLPDIYYVIFLVLSTGFIMGLLLPLSVVFFIFSLLVSLWSLFVLRMKWWNWFIPFTITLLAFLLSPNVGMAPAGWLGGGLLLVYSLVLNLLQRYYRNLIILPSIVFLVVGISFLSDFAFDNLLKPHQQDRINVWLHPDKTDPHGSLYNVLQSETAIGSGGLQGKGFRKGHMTGLSFVPEQTTDFIFSTVGEEQGFIGSVAIVLIFLMLVLRIFQMGERSEHPFILYYAYGLGGLLFFHFFVNIGMTMGLVPIIGIPLPFISKGGSAILVFSVMMAIMLKMDNPSR
ncbi:MAG TPA: rod shape-determining protein RodA [Phaeodactylibacter sp.]|nr:rod shape-determining protein RodA [Phaeodactylibacter sp.]